MLPPFSRLLLCLWLCTEAAASQLPWKKTKTTFSSHYESAAAGWNVQSRGWRAVAGGDNGGTRGASAQASWLDTVELSPPEGIGTHIRRRAVRKSDAHNGERRPRLVHGDKALRTAVSGAVERRGGGCSPGEEVLHGRTCRQRGAGRNRRHSRSAKPGRTERQGGAAAALEALPSAMAQEQEARTPFEFNTSDYGEEFSIPDFPDATPFVPVSTRTRRKQVKNPFYPVTAESYGAYAVTVVAAVIFGVGILGNVSVMCIVCHNYSMRSISNSLLANLALWDFIILFFCLPLVVFHELTKSWLLGQFSCRIVPYLEVASLGVTTFTLCALCIDRFRAAANVQMHYEMVENWASTAAKLAVIWAGALLLALPELLLRQLASEDGEPPGVAPCERCVVRVPTGLPDTLYVLGLTYDGARLWWYFGCYFCLPTLFTICSSLATARKIRRAERACVRGGGGGDKTQVRQESQMNCAVVALAIVYGSCIVPENICNIITAYMAASVPRRTLDVLQLVSQLLLFCKSAATPVLLFCLCPPFTRAFLDCCCCCCDACGPPRPAATADDARTTDELELSAFGTAVVETPTSAARAAVVATHC